MYSQLKTIFRLGGIRDFDVIKQFMLIFVSHKLLSKPPRTSANWGRWKEVSAEVSSKFIVLIYRPISNTPPRYSSLSCSHSLLYSSQPHRIPLKRFPWLLLSIAFLKKEAEGKAEQRRSLVCCSVRCPGHNFSKIPFACLIFSQECFGTAVV